MTMLPNRLYNLDVARGIASLSVVLWHWQHFLPKYLFQRLVPRSLLMIRCRHSITNAWTMLQNDLFKNPNTAK